MVRIEENKLVIELDNGNLEPLEYLQYLKRGIISAIGCIGEMDHISRIPGSAIRAVQF